jgi:hypothetical protein
MLPCFSAITLDGTAQIFEIFTPVILFIWFLYSQEEKFRKNYQGEIPGIYGGYTTPVIAAPPGHTIYAGAILSIKSVNSDGFFIGEFDYGERDRAREDGPPQIISSLNTFFGHINYHVSFKRDVHPLKPETNRTYKGKLYVVDRIDIPFKISAIESFITYEFDVTHYREMGVLELTFSREYRKSGFEYPQSLILQKSKGIGFEPYQTLKETVFGRHVISDKNKPS